MSDLSFRGREEVRVLGGATAFRPVPGPEGASCFLAGSVAGGDAALAGAASRADLFGRFVLLTHDPARRSLTVECDRHGFLPFYLARSPHALLLSTRIAPLADSEGPRPDPRALSDFLAFGFCLGERTLVPGVTSLEAGSRLRVDLDTLEVRAERVWDPVPRLRGGARPLAEAREELVELFLEGVDRCAERGSAVALTLSGGLDTRCIAAAAVQQGLAPTAYHVGVSGSRATRYTTRIASACGIPLRCHALDPDFASVYPALVEEVVRLTEGMKFEPQVEMLWLRDRVEDAPVMLHGAYGEIAKLEVLRAFRVDAETRAAGRAGLAAVLWRRFEPRFRARLALFSPEFRAELEPHARRDLEQHVEAVDDDLDGTGALQVLYFREFPKTARYGHLVWNARLPTRFPFVYPPFVDRLLEVRPADRMQPAFHLAFLARVRPDLLDLPDENTGAHVRAPRLWTSLVGALDRIRAAVSDSKVESGHNDLLGWVAGSVASFEALLAASGSDPIYDRRSIQAMVDAVRGIASLRGLARARRIRAARRSAEALQTLLVLECWRRTFGMGAGTEDAHTA